MKGRILLLSLSLVFLSGCVREESPIWYMTKSDAEIDQYFKKTCLGFGHIEESPEDLNNCIKVARESSARDANNRLYQAGQQMQQMDIQRIQKHNTAVNKIQQKNKQANIYDSNGQYQGFSRGGNWYNSQGQRTGYIKDDNIYDVDNKYIGYKVGGKYYNTDGSYAGHQ